MRQHHLRIKLSPESSNEQQLTDDGFEELARYQEHWPSLRELDIQVTVRIIRGPEHKAVLGILGLPDPDRLVRDTDLDPDRSLFSKRC
jgi:hypothetical protein